MAGLRGVPRLNIWTDEMIEELKGYLREHKKLGEIAGLMGLTKSQCMSKSAEIRRKERESGVYTVPIKEAYKWASDDVKTLKRLISEGKTNDEIAQEMGISRIRVRDKRYALERKAKQKVKMTRKDNLSDICRKAAAEGLSYGEYVGKYGV